MSIVRVDCAAGRLTFGDLAMDCTIGRGGACAAADKREGDGCTPTGSWPIRGVLLRPGKVDAAGIRLPWRWVRTTLLTWGSWPAATWPTTRSSLGWSGLAPRMLANWTA